VELELEPATGVGEFPAVGALLQAARAIKLVAETTKDRRRKEVIILVSKNTNKKFPQVTYLLKQLLANVSARGL
jgi:hypothetical protein